MGAGNHGPLRLRIYPRYCRFWGGSVRHARPETRYRRWPLRAGGQCGCIPGERSRRAPRRVQQVRRCSEGTFPRYGGSCRRCVPDHTGGPLRRFPVVAGKLQGRDPGERQLRRPDPARRAFARHEPAAGNQHARTVRHLLRRAGRRALGRLLRRRLRTQPERQPEPIHQSPEGCLGPALRRPERQLSVGRRPVPVRWRELLQGRRPGQATARRVRQRHLQRQDRRDVRRPQPGAVPSAQRRRRRFRLPASVGLDLPRQLDPVHRLQLAEGAFLDGALRPGHDAPRRTGAVVHDPLRPWYGRGLLQRQ
ncbi:hypothetical protein D3C78_644110 [compost metagenome]